MKYNFNSTLKDAVTTIKHQMKKNENKIKN